VIGDGETGMPIRVWHLISIVKKFPPAYVEVRQGFLNPIEYSTRYEKRTPRKKGLAHEKISRF
jgi:hypothetical protein